jgi:hypothetical protein
MRKSLHLSLHLSTVCFALVSGLAVFCLASICLAGAAQAQRGDVRGARD